MSTTVHILITGSYSDKRNAGVYTTAELAERAQQRLMDPEDSYIEEWDVDAPVPDVPPGKKLFDVCIYGRGGYAYQEELVGFDVSLLNQVIQHGDDAKVFVYAANNRAAVKIASELVAKHRALAGVNRPPDASRT
jgi:hypothetical protein